MAAFYCDRCGKQVDGEAAIELSARGGATWTLCGGCYRGFVNVWLRGFGRGGLTGNPTNDAGRGKGRRDIDDEHDI
jgi:hypothetical protein